MRELSDGHEEQVTFIDTEAQFVDMLSALGEYSSVAVDAEGVNLGRTGPLTVLSIGGIDVTAPVYVVDVQTLGTEIAFSTTTNSLKTLLEDTCVQKVTFDCRNDSDALWHQFNVLLTGVLELQVLDQAVRIQRGETPPHNCPYVDCGQVQRLQGLEAVAKRNLIALKSMNAPHKTRSDIWALRPLESASIAYAANDIYAIKMLYRSLQPVSLLPQLKEGVREHSKRYEVECRELQANQSVNKQEEVAIIDFMNLPADHEHRLPQWPQHMTGRMRWDEVSITLRLKRKCTRVFNRTLFVLQHDDWYTKEAYSVLAKWVEEYPHFTAKQRRILECPPALPRYDSDY